MVLIKKIFLIYIIRLLIEKFTRLINTYGKTFRIHIIFLKKQYLFDFIKFLDRFK